MSLQGAVASGTGVNLFWNDCPLGPTATTLRTFACDTNEGFHVLTASFVPPPGGLPALTGVNASVDLLSESCPLMSWWEFKNLGTCRRFDLSVNALLLPGQGACADLFQAQATVEIMAYFLGLGGNYRRARVVVSVSAPTEFATPVEAGTEYYAFNLIIRNARTLGADACGGCTDRVCVVLDEMQLVQPTGTPGGNPVLDAPLVANHAAWQGWVSDCACVDCIIGPCTTPTLNRTWGQIKGIYR